MKASLTLSSSNRGWICLVFWLLWSLMSTLGSWVSIMQYDHFNICGPIMQYQEKKKTKRKWDYASFTARKFPLQMQKSCSLKNRVKSTGLCPWSVPHPLGCLLAAVTGCLGPWHGLPQTAPPHLVNGLISCCYWDLPDHLILPMLSQAWLSFLPGFLEPIAIHALTHFLKAAVHKCNEMFITKFSRFQLKVIPCLFSN